MRIDICNDHAHRPVGLRSVPTQTYYRDPRETYVMPRSTVIVPTTRYYIWPSFNRHYYDESDRLAFHQWQALAEELKSGKTESTVPQRVNSVTAQVEWQTGLIMPYVYLQVLNTPIMTSIVH